MHVALRGNGPPLVLIHGWAMHGGLFGGLLDELAGQRTLHVVDLPGHGRSRADATPLTLAACVHAIAAVTPPAPWLGWSLGGLFALHAAATRPAQVPALAMMCSSPCFVRAPDWPHGMDVATFRRFEADLRDDVHATVERFLVLETLGCESARGDLRALRQLAFACGDPLPSALGAGLQLLENADLRILLPNLQVPSLWIGARRDRLVDPRAVVAAAALAPGAAHLQLDSGHAPFLTHPQALASAILDFLASAQGATSATPGGAAGRTASAAIRP